MTGSIPAFLGSLTNLTYLDLRANQLSGSIPAELGNLANLKELWLWDNNLTGSIPPQLGNLTNLTALGLDYNYLTGSIPPELGNLTNLTKLRLSFNQLTGSLPAQLGNLTNLNELRLGNNKLAGEIPASITGFSSLTSLSLSCGLTSSDPAVIAFVENLVLGWQAARCVTTITADTPDPSLPGQAVNVTVTVGGGATTPTGTVDISGADTNCQITLSGGIGSCNVKFNTPGAKTLTAIYNGDSTYSGSWDSEAHSVKAQFNSVAARDGWVLESAESSNKGGTRLATGTLRLGDDAANKQYRSILDFNTASLPDNAILTKVMLKIKKASVIGTDPFTTHGNLVADICKGYFGLASLEIADFQSAASKTNIGRFTAVSGQLGWYQLVISATNFQYINLKAVTQFRLRFTKDDNNDKGADYVNIYAGDAAATRRPALLIEYTLP